MAHRLSREYCMPETDQLFTVDDQEFVLRGKLGDGAVGLVRKAQREGSDHKYAVKFLAPDPNYIDETVFDDVKSRFRREGQRGTKVEHISLLKIHAYVENENGNAFLEGTPQNPFLLMDRSMGGTVEDYIRRSHHNNQFILDETRLRIAIQVTEALQYLHRQDLVHRDVKPANIFLSSRRLDNSSVVAKLGDFGVMKWGDFHASLSTGTLTATMQEGLGTLKYMSPEQALQPKDVNVKADIFSLGLTLFELFTGKILPNHHHVYKLMMARAARGTTIGRWVDLGFQLSGTEVDIGEVILDMLLRSTRERPSIDKVYGRLQWVYQHVTGKQELDDLKFDLGEAFLNFSKAIVVEMKTGDTSQLLDTVTSDQLDYVQRIPNHRRRPLRCWEIIDIWETEIRDSSETFAEASFKYNIMNEEDKPERTYDIVSFEIVDGEWKVAEADISHDD